MKTILIVEDSKFLRVANERLLANAGYHVISAADGELAVQMARDKQPDLILLDMLLPKVSGEQVLERLKADVKTAELPVVILTSLWQGNERKLREAGAAALLEKKQIVEDPGPLLQLIAQVLKKQTAPSKA